LNRITAVCAHVRAAGIAVVLALLPVAAAQASAGGPCGPAIAAAETRYGLPPGLLRAIAQVETGRTDPRTGATEPWPFTTNAENQGTYFDSREAAVAWVLATQARGVASIDVGCLQVNLRQHPEAFARIEDGFDPVHNADYAARFLLRLHAASGDWAQAVGEYHSHTEALAVPYRAQVARSYAGGSDARSERIFAEAVMSQRERNLRDLAAAWAATLPARSETRVSAGWDQLAAAQPWQAAAASPPSGGRWVAPQR
jgi:hypothetical protein